MRIIILLIVLLGYLLYGLVEPDQDNKELQLGLGTDAIRVEVDVTGSGWSEIRYVDIGDVRDRMFIFIHGAPGTLDAFNIFLKDPELRKKIRMIAMDRPGYGHSNPGHAVTSITQQAASIEPLLDKNLHDSKPILIGHSYGAPIAAKIAMTYPDKVGGIILVGAAIDPEYEKFFTIAELAGIPLIQKILPASFRVAYEEKYSHVEELKAMQNGWKEITCPAIIIHGDKDRLVPVENARFAERMLSNADIQLSIYENTGHLIPWTKPGLLKKEILLLAK